MTDAAVARPHYITLDDVQVRLWHAGLSRGRVPVVAFAGLNEGAEDLASQLTQQLPRHGIAVFEVPGIGTLDPDHLARPAGTLLAQALNAWGLRDYVLIAPGMTAGYLGDFLPELTHVPRKVLVPGLARARDWAAAPARLPDIAPRQDGSHLTAFWCHLRDYFMLTSADLALADPAGDPIPAPESIQSCIAAAAMSPTAYIQRWKDACAGMGNLPDGVQDVAIFADLSRNVPDDKAAPAPDLPTTAPLAGGKIWYHYVDTPRGRIHLRRCGDEGPPLLVIGTGGGSSAQFGPVVQGLANDRQVFSMDFIGNGQSEKISRETSIEVVAEDVLALMTAMGFDRFSIWASHTGSLVALEVGVRAPDRIDRLVLEGPVFIEPAFQQDLLKNYFIDFEIDAWGRHIQTLWHWRRDMFLFWPWYRTDRASARQLGLPTAENLHLYMMGVLESGPTYGDAYASAFRYDTAPQMRALSPQTLVCAGPNDMLVNGVEETRKLENPSIRTLLTPTTVWWPDPDPELTAQSLKIYDDFLTGKPVGLGPLHGSQTDRQ